MADHGHRADLPGHAPLATARREEPLDVCLPDPVISYDGETDPEHEALAADAVGLALLVALERLTPAERLAFVLHDLFGVPFSEIGPIVGRTPDAAKMPASRARRRVRSGSAESDSDPRRQREIVDAFLAAVRAGGAPRPWPGARCCSPSLERPLSTRWSTAGRAWSPG
jgi:Sigma-70, region 4